MIFKERISRKRERAGAKDIGGNSSYGSGNQWHSKADFSNDYFIVEDKFTKSFTFSLSLDMLKYIDSAGLRHARIPVLRFGFEVGTRSNYAVLQKKDVIGLVTASHNVLVYNILKTNESELNELFPDLPFELEKEELPCILLTFTKDGSEYRIFEWDFFVRECEAIIGL